MDRYISMLSQLCGKDAMDLVAIVTTKWGRHNEPESQIEGLMDQVDELSKGSWSDMLSQGASIFHALPNGKSGPPWEVHRTPWDIVHQMILLSNSRSGPRTLNIQHEKKLDFRRLLHKITGSCLSDVEGNDDR